MILVEQFYSIVCIILLWKEMIVINL